MTHRLDPLLRPRAIAVYGASERPRSVGRRTVNNLLVGKFDGRIFPVNPGREKVLGLTCYPSLADLPETADLVVFCVADTRIEAALDEAIAHGARAVSIMSQLLLREDTEPPLNDRIAARVREAGLLMCGPNGMGFYNFHDGVWACGFDTRDNHPRGGNTTLISQSGSGMSGLVDCEERIDFNLAVSTGQEMAVGMADYMDFAIEALETRAIGLFVETARDPAAFIAALDKANARDIPVVAIKVGRTALAARLARSHSGAIAGEDAAWEALFDRYGVHRARDVDELAAALMLFAQPHPVADGGLVSLHDSGGERQLLIDIADEMGTPLTELSDASVARLSRQLDPGLPPINPLDGWGMGGPDSAERMAACLATLMADPGAALGAVVHARGPKSAIYEEYIDYMRTAHAATGKPVCLVANHQGSGSDPRAVASTREGFPVLDGLRPFLAAVNMLLARRDQRRRPADEPLEADSAAVRAAGNALAPGAMDEHASGEWLRRLGLPMNPQRLCTSESAVMQAARDFGYPLAMKTAAAHISHKTEHDGVRLGLGDEPALRAAWQDLSARLGPRVTVSPLLRGGLEMTLGMVHDPQFGALVMMGFGGVRLEAVRDVVCALPPFGPQTARRLLGRLRQRALFNHDRGEGRPDLDAYCRAASLFSVVVAELADRVAEIDINPLIVDASGCTAVDALVIGAGGHPNIERKAS